MSAAIDKRLDKLEAEISASLEELGTPIEALCPTDVLDLLATSYQDKRISGLPLAKRKDHLQVVYRLSDPSAVEFFTHPYKNVGCIIIWRLFVVPYDLVHVMGVSFYFDLPDDIRKVGDGIVSCENPDDVAGFGEEVLASPVGQVLQSVKPVGAKFMNNVVGCRGDYVFDPKVDVAVTLTCKSPDKHQRIVELFDLIVREGGQDLLGLTADKALAERRDIFFEQLEDKLAWTQEHQFRVVWGYAHLLMRMETAGSQTTMHFVIDAYRKHFCSQISAMLKELGADSVAFTETPHSKS